MKQGEDARSGNSTALASDASEEPASRGNRIVPFASCSGSGSGSDLVEVRKAMKRTEQYDYHGTRALRLHHWSLGTRQCASNCTGPTR
jgi:hypothetical protein